MFWYYFVQLIFQSIILTENYFTKWNYPLKESLQDTNPFKIMMGHTVFGKSQETFAEFGQGNLWSKIIGHPESISWGQIKYFDFLTGTTFERVNKLFVVDHGFSYKGPINSYLSISASIYLSETSVAWNLPSSFFFNLSQRYLVRLTQKKQNFRENSILSKYE